MSSEEHHVALPKLYGAPAYARPPRPAEAIDRPIDPDDLPLEVLRTPEEQELASQLFAGVFATSTAGGSNGHDGNGRLEGRPFRIRALTSRLFGN